MTVLTFTVPGIPVPQGSKRHVGNGVMIEANQALKPWRQEVIAAGIDAAVKANWVCAGKATYAVKIVFTFKRPKSHHRVTGALMPSAPAHPGVRPDLDKLIRAVFDALTQAAVVWDDSQIVRLIAMKTYGAPGLSVALERLT